MSRCEDDAPSAYVGQQQLMIRCHAHRHCCNNWPSTLLLASRGNCAVALPAPGVVRSIESAQLRRERTSSGTMKRVSSMWRREDSTSIIIERSSVSTPSLSRDTESPGMVLMEPLELSQFDSLLVESLDNTEPTSSFEHELMKSPVLVYPSVAAAPNHRVLGTLSIAAISFFAACGGPSGSEPIVSAGGPLVGLVALTVYPIFCQLPFALGIAELCTAFPEDGGFAIWIKNAFGPFWGFQAGYWAWMAGMLNNAIYPGLIYSALRSTGLTMLPDSGVGAYFIKVAIAIAMATPTILGVRHVARFTMLLTTLVLLPILIFTVWAFVVADNNSAAFSQVRTRDEGGIDWGLLINTVFWNFDGIYMASVFGGEVSNPARAYIRAITITSIMTLLCYLLPISAAVAADRPHWTTYEEDSLPTIAEAIGGNVLHQIIVTSSIFSSIGMFVASLFCHSFQVCGMAEINLLPAFFRRRNARFDTPHNAVLLGLVPTVLLVAFDFEAILPMTNVFSAATEIMIIFTLVQLRRSLPYVPRPTKVPGGLPTIAAIMLLPLCMLIYIMVTAFFKRMAAMCIGLFLLPGIFYGLYQHQQLHQADVPSPRTNTVFIS